jgi:hypothetical protein
MIQPEGHVGDSVPLIFMLHDAPYQAVELALEKIAKLPVTRAEPVAMRVESFD